MNSNRDITHNQFWVIISCLLALCFIVFVGAITIVKYNATNKEAEIARYNYQIKDK